MKNMKTLALAFVAMSLAMLLNLLAKQTDARLDLTEDKRYTISDMTSSFLQEQEEDWQIEVYLDGAINASFLRLEKATLAMLRRMQAMNKTHFNYASIKVDDLSKSEKATVLKHLQAMACTPMNIVDEDNNGKRIQKEVYPWAIVTKGKAQRAVKLLVNVRGKSGEENLTASIENMEFQLMEAMRAMADQSQRRIAFLEGHGELNEGDTYDITSALSHYYSVDRGVIGDDAGILDAYEAVIVAGPTEPFSEKDKYVLDQYIMYGGKVLWLVDGVKMSMDSLTKAATNYGIYNEVNLSDMLFKYGVRINPDLVQDLQCALYPVNVAGLGETPRYQPLPWFYAPLLQGNEEYAISRNLSSVKSEFISTLDLVGKNENIVSKILLHTSSHTKIAQVPIPIDLGQSAEELDVKSFNSGIQDVGVLLEGEFESVFAHRSSPKDLQVSKTKKEKGQSKMIVIADGDLIKNDLRGYGEQTQVIPLGFDMASGQVLFGNKPFLVNAINYLVDDNGWYQLRQRQLKLRLLDKKELQRRTFYRILNVAVPLFVLGLLSLAFLIIRRKRYR